MKARLIWMIGLTGLAVFSGYRLSAHCQIPCGIYDDEARIASLKEHVKTIAKSMTQIIDLSASDKPDYNQLVRWVNNKDEHAQQFMDIVTAYFLCQRIKVPADDTGAEKDKYLKELSTLHRMLVTSMKCKQTTDLTKVEELNELIHEFEHLYLGEEHQH